MTEFNLSEKRKQMFLRLQNEEPFMSWIIQVIEKEVEKQDKEFIRLVKKGLNTEFKFVVGCAACKNNINEIIDKLAGDKLC